MKENLSSFKYIHKLFTLIQNRLTCIHNIYKIRPKEQRFSSERSQEYLDMFHISVAFFYCSWYCLLCMTFILSTRQHHCLVYFQQCFLLMLGAKVGNFPVQLFQGYKWAVIRVNLRGGRSQEERRRKRKAVTVNKKEFSNSLCRRSSSILLWFYSLLGPWWLPCCNMVESFRNIRS